MDRDTDPVDLSAPPRTRVAVFVGVAVLHGVAVLALIRAFAPGAMTAAVDKVLATFTVTITAPPPEPPTAPEPAGAAGEAGRKAVARAEAAPVPKVSLAPRPAPRAASTGDAPVSGAAAAGSGSGAGGSGPGTGSGAGGNGSGGGQARPAEKTAGAIVEKDYDKAGRALRLGHAVAIAIDVSAEGRPTGCRVVRASPDPAADAVTCRLAVDRFRFRPARDAAGNPVASVYGWQQRWFY